MAFDIPGTRHSFEAAGNLTASHYKFVKMSGANIAAVASADDKGIGVLQNKPASAGEVGTVMVDGITKVLSSKAIVAGVPVYLAADGRVTDTASATPNFPVGIAVSAASGADKVFSVLLRPLGSLA
ncbi:DUF2190 family protein [Streptomyces sp. NPDC006477]|uniref:DUF2190 family protein n=1 Tax=Streptomyces sp. NPDC006477 TaxID=3364747 RepID=UPI0036CFBA32